MEWSSDVGQADWVRDRLSPFDSGVVTSVVPGGFAAYAKIFHPASQELGQAPGPVRWAEVAAWSGLPLAADSQFPDIALPEHPPPGVLPWSGGPGVGTLSETQATALVETLSARTVVRPWWFCIWEGYGWEGPDDPVPRDVRAGPRARLPHRDHLLYAGRPGDASAFVGSQGQSPTLWWPADHSWCVASEVDLAWTYVGGSADLIAAVTSAPRLEALVVSPDVIHHQSFPAWVTARAKEAARQVMHAGRATVETPYGTLFAAVTRDRRGQHVLTVDRYPVSEVFCAGSSGEWSSHPPSEKSLVRTLSFAITELLP